MRGLWMLSIEISVKGKEFEKDGTWFEGEDGNFV